MSVLANAGNLADIFFISRHLFTVLLSKSSSDCSTKHHLEGMMSAIESFKEDSLKKHSSFFNNTINEKQVNFDIDFLF